MNLSVLPLPVRCDVRDGSFFWDGTVVLECSAELAAVAAVAMGDWLPGSTSAREASVTPEVSVTTEASTDTTGTRSGPAPRLVLKIDPDRAPHAEGYQLEITESRIEISAADEAGVFYGLQTLRQLLPSGRSPVAGTLPCLTIEDHPRFSWRGFHLDVSRHMFPLEFVRKQIDVLASYKFNSLHLHLTDDQGWRFEVTKYPRLTGTGSRRESSPIPEDREHSDGTPYEGFYTQQELADLVAYASARFVNLVPEIEMPGHAVAALAAYPDLGCKGSGYRVRTTWGIEDEVFCAGNDEVFRFLEDVLTEVFTVFPSPFVHIGGDECPKLRWSKCARCQDRMRAEDLANEDELQSWFVGKMAQFLAARGKRLIGWDEICEGRLPALTAVMSWRGTEGGVAAARAGHDVVMSPTSHCYFDYCQSVDRAQEPPAFDATLTLRKVLEFDPCAGVPSAVQHRILGGQANLWTEYIPTPLQAEYQTFPRALAMSEALWSSLPAEGRDFEEFLVRLEPQLERLERRGVSYRRGLREDS